MQVFVFERFCFVMCLFYSVEVCKLLNLLGILACNFVMRSTAERHIGKGLHGKAAEWRGAAALNSHARLDKNEITKLQIINNAVSF